MNPSHLNPPLGRHTRGYLPHWEIETGIQGITFHLADSLPAAKIHEWTERLAHLPEGEATLRMRKLIQDFLDRGHGECLLAKPEIGRMVEDALLYFNEQRYVLLAWCVMPNHVHSLPKMMKEWRMSSIVHSWRSFTSHEANRMLRRHGQFWQEEYHDRYIRDERHLENAVRYIEMNPVKAGLCQEPEDWPFSSAWRRKKGMLPNVLLR